MEVVMGWELHIVRTEHWFDSASVPISSEEWLQLVNDDKELSIDNKNGDFFALWSGQSELDEPCSSSTDKKQSLWVRLISKVKKF